MLGTYIENVRNRAPLVHNITNYVTVNDVADAVTEENLSEAIQFVKFFAKEAGCIIAVTGAIDLVSDGDTCQCNLSKPNH